MQNKALILGSNNTNGLSAIRCLGMHGVHTVAVDYSSTNNYGARSKYCSERLIAPHYRHDPEGFIAFLKDYALKQSCPPVLIACHDYYVEIIDAHFEELKGCFLIVQQKPGLNTALMNKENLYRLAIEHGVTMPETVSIKEDNYLEKIRETIKYPCLVKPLDSPSFVSKFRVKLFKVHNEAELLEALDKARDAHLEVFVQRLIPGFDDHMYTYDAYLDQKSQVINWVTCQKYRQFPINFGASTYLGHNYIPALHEIGSKFLSAVGFTGFAEIEFKKDSETGRFYMIEINVRLTNFDAFLAELGLNVPYTTYRELIGQPIQQNLPKADRRLAFWYAYEDLISIKQYLKAGQLSIRQVISSLRQPKVYAIWDWNDPKPGISFASMIAARLTSKISAKLKPTKEVAS